MFRRRFVNVKPLRVELSRERDDFVARNFPRSELEHRPGGQIFPIVFNVHGSLLGTRDVCSGEI
jgi:hypothetical protein